MRAFLVALAATFAVAGGPNAMAQDGDPPNVLLIIADDMGLEVSPCYPFDAEKPDMPVLEAMCRDGLVFDNVWAQPVCSPTRATILTGRYGFRTGVLYPSGGPFGGGINPDELSLQRFLDGYAPVSYAHAVIGKWHLSDDDNGGDDNPEVMGVGFYSGFISGTLPDYYDFPLTTDGATADATDYATTLFTDIAIDWLAAQTGPWFLWLAHTAPHTPFHVPPEGLHDRQLDDSRAAMRADPLPYYLAALEALDHEIGRLLDALEPDARDNTVVIFIGDNGTPEQVAQAPYTSATVKGTLYPGGVRVPMVVSGAGITRKGEREAALINTTDLFATIADLAGIAATPAEDSISFKPLLSSDADGGRAFLYADLEAPEGMPMADNGGWTVGDGRYQFLQLYETGRHLFDIDTDPGGAVNLLESGDAEAEAIAARLEQIGLELRGDR